MDDATLIRALFETQSWSVHDVDDAGRLLVTGNPTGTQQAYELAPDGTRTQLTALPGSCSARYLPGRRAALISHDTDGDERTQVSVLELGKLPSTPAGLENLTPLLRDPEHIHAVYDVDARSLIYGCNRRNGTDFDVYVRDLSTGSESVLYDGGGWPVDAVVAHDRQTVAIPRLSAKHAASTVITLAQHGRTASLTDPAEPGVAIPVCFTPADDAILVTADHGADRNALYRVTRDGQTWTQLRADPDADLHAWADRSGARLLLARRARGTCTLSIVSADGADIVAVDTDPVSVLHAVWSPDGATVAVTYSTPTTPAAVARVDARTGEFTTVLDGADTMPQKVRTALGRYEYHEVPARDGERIPVFLMRAPGDPLRGATVLHIHGGPESEAGQEFSLRVQALLLAGFNVVVPNVRGSDGYGRRWLSLDDVELRLDSVADLADIHAWLPSVGLDNTRAALCGGSYGGYMTLAGLALQPDLWAAGVDIVGMSSLVTFLENTSPYRRAFREREYGSLAHDRDALVAASPLTYLEQMRAPLFIIHGANDPRVPLSEAQQIADAYARKGIRHELMVFPDEGHGLAKRVNQLAAYPRAFEFLRDVLA